MSDQREAHEMSAEREKRLEAIEMAKRCANDPVSLTNDWGDAEISYQGVAFIGQELLRLERELEDRDRKLAIAEEALRGCQIQAKGAIFSPLEGDPLAACGTIEDITVKAIAAISSTPQEDA